MLRPRQVARVGLQGCVSRSGQAFEPWAAADPHWTRNGGGTAYRMLVELSHATHSAHFGRDRAPWEAWINPHKGSDRGSDLKA